MDELFDSQGLGGRVNELLLLSSLQRSPMHGYQIAIAIEERSKGFFRFNHGTLYPVLHRLEKEGLIAGEWTDPRKGRARKQYALTEAGRTHLAEGARHWRTLEARLAPFLSDQMTDGPVRTGAA